MAWNTRGLEGTSNTGEAQTPIHGKGRGMNLAMKPNDAFREWFNEFLTIEGFALYYGIEIKEARALIEEGRKIEYTRKENA
jgi:hypothetical protein